MRIVGDDVRRSAAERLGQELAPITPRTAQHDTAALRPPQFGVGDETVALASGVATAARCARRREPAQVVPDGVVDVGPQQLGWPVNGVLDGVGGEPNHRFRLRLLRRYVDQEAA